VKKNNVSSFGTRLGQQLTLMDSPMGVPTLKRKLHEKWNVVLLGKIIGTIELPEGLATERIVLRETYGSDAGKVMLCDMGWRVYAKKD